MSSLPEDVLFHVFRFLNPFDLANTRSVCLAWNTASKQESIWQFLCEERWIWSKPELTEAIHSWRDLFILRHRQDTSVVRILRRMEYFEDKPCNMLEEDLLELGVDSIRDILDAICRYDIDEQEQRVGDQFDSFPWSHKRINIPEIDVIHSPDQRNCFPDGMAFINPSHGVLWRAAIKHWDLYKRDHRINLCIHYHTVKLLDR